ncbi:MAG: metal-activated pyridoxal enzyme [Frankiales bacterium]|nr:metal-activated pyridoxal enzyme [Frankiales bacterium]
MKLSDLTTPALVVDRDKLDANLATMAAVLPGTKLRPHVKAFKTTALARRMADLGHTGFTCATVREVEGMAAAGLGEDLLLANEVLDARRLGAITNARVTVAVDSRETVDAAAAGGVREVLIDVNVGLPRCGVDPDKAGALADYARSKGLEVRGVMGYEGHVMLVDDPAEKARQVEECMSLLLKASADVGGDLVSAGGTGTFEVNTYANEIQAGSYCLMDTTYAHAGIAFEQALTVLSTIISVNEAGWFVADLGLKALGMDHGNPTIPGASVWYCADEHTVFSADGGQFAIGDRIRVWPSHIDPTIALHEKMHLVDGDDVLETWDVDLRGW